MVYNTTVYNFARKRGGVIPFCLGWAVLVVFIGDFHLFLTVQVGIKRGTSAGQVGVRMDCFLGQHAGRRR